MTRYYDYLHLDKLLSSQVPKSEAHHEFFFIVIHQVYELWFSAILRELDSVMETFKDGEVEVIKEGVSKPKGIDEQEIAVMVSKLNRIIEILKLLVAQIRVMETLTPLDFLDFRDQLLPASGYDSLQFRMIEVKLGLRLVDGRTDVFKQHGFPHKEKFDGNKFAEAQLEALTDANQNRSLFDYMESWLERTPFVQPEGMGSWFEPEFKNIPKPDEASVRDAIEKMQEIFDAGNYEIFVKEFQDRKGMSHAAFLAALFIHLYRDKPILQQPHRLLEALKEVDELFTVWRHWHSSMVMRMIGQKPGTAGYEKTVTQPEEKPASADGTYGYKYLEGTRAYRFFPELARVSTYMIPRRYLPDIPANVTLEMERLLFTDRT
jgi:tryptophan 2,3-dioxygenase